MAGMAAGRFFPDGTRTILETPASMRLVADGPGKDALLKQQFIERNRRLYADLRRRGLLSDAGENLVSQEITEYLTAGAGPEEH